uniref:Uncharacterized protein n=1 Tax=Pseudomonas phage Nican01 TaxID=3138540 RepID=A0AAU6W092_9CAUD
MIWPFTELKKLRDALAMANETNLQAERNFRSLHRTSVEQGNLIDKLTSKVTTIAGWCETAEANEKKLAAELEIERMRLVACGVAAMSNTRESAGIQRVKKDSPFYCASVQDVHNAVDREMALREKVETYEQALRELSCLGNGERPGNSNGNMIAIRALEKHSSTKNCVKCGCEMIPMHDTDKKLCSNGACGHEVDWKLEEGQRYMYKENVEPFVEDRSKSQDDLEPPRSNLERL